VFARWSSDQREWSYYVEGHETADGLWQGEHHIKRTWEEDE
jgi:hypothetical protein